MKINIVVLFLMLFSGCAANIKDVDISQAEPDCARQCTAIYSSCVSGGNTIGVPYALQSACKESFKKCIQTCPNKK
jgi:hypothetical protein